LGEESPDTTE